MRDDDRVTDPRFEGIAIPSPSFAGDDGSADPGVVAALTDFALGTGSRSAVCAALDRTRLLVPVVAVLDEVEVGDDGLARDKSSHMATVSMVAPDGSRALLAFTCTDALTRWDPQARPVPAVTAAVAESALEQEADAMVIDIAGPVRCAMTGAHLRALAQGRRWIPPAHDTEVHDVVAEYALDCGIAVESFGEGPEGELLVTVVPPKADAAAVLEQLAQRLSANVMIRDRCDRGISLAVAVD